MRLRSLSMLGMLAVLAALLLAVSASGEPGDTATKTYIVQMLKDPLVAYDGGVAGIPATAPARGEKVDPNSSAAQRYTAHLNGDHANALAQVGGADTVYDYSVTFNGFAADLTAAQAAKLEKVDGVLSVTPDEIRQPDTSTTPHFIGLDAPTGLWTRAGGPAKAGEDVIVGIVDTGIWPEHPSFSDKALTGFPRVVYDQAPFRWNGACQTGEEWHSRNCNRKLIGARFFNDGFGAESIASSDYLSTRDSDGHGSHTASTAAGNHDVQATGDAAALGKISGMAPRARVAAYKVCWLQEGAAEPGCATSDSVAAIDQAVADGVDVINFSISGTRTNFLDPVEIAWLFAADAGVFVAASAGNTDGPSTVAHPSPWITTVAASTHDRGGVGSVTLGNGATFNGASLAPKSVSGPFIDSEAAGKAGANAEQVRLCFLGSLDPAKINGKIVQCDRGVNARIDKSLEVRNGGGIGMVLTNTAPIGVNADLHFVPSVHLESTDHAAIEAYAATPGATATIAKGQITTVPAPFMAGFSSDGPLLAGGGDILKPDVTAPGVDVVAAVSPPGNHGRLFDLLSGTSMSSPHVAGLGAMLTQLHPDWSPMAQKSALMTTAYSVSGANQLNFGGGHVDASKAGDPGLVYESGFTEWLMFLQGQDCHCLPPSFPKIDASDLNQASIAIGQLAGKQTVTRRVTNVADSYETYTASFSGLAGVTAVANPSTLTIGPGETKSFTVEFTRTTATLNSYALGYLTWTGNLGHAVRSPIAVKPVPLSAPTELTGSGTSGSSPFNVTFGFDGTWSAAVRGLIPADKRAGNVAQDPDQTFDTANPDSNGAPGTTRHDFTVPAGTTYARFSLFDDENDGATDDLDMYVYRVNTNGTKTLVGVSAGGTAEEEVNLVDPQGGLTYNVFIHGWQTDGPDTNYNLFGWVLGSAAAGNASVTPNSGTAVNGQSQALTLNWSGLTAGTKYLGRIAYSGVAGGSPVAGMPLTTVRIDG